MPPSAADAQAVARGEGAGVAKARLELMKDWVKQFNSEGG